MTYVAPSITELGSVHDLTLKPGKGGGNGGGPNKGTGSYDGRSGIPSDPKPGGGGGGGGYS